MADVWPREPPPPPSEEESVQHQHRSHQEMVDHPQHYGGEANPHEHVKCMRGILSKSPLDPFAGGLMYNCTKYLWRLGQKPVESNDERVQQGMVLQDAEKAKWYLDELVRYLKGDVQQT